MYPELRQCCSRPVSSFLSLPSLGACCSAYLVVLRGLRSFLHLLLLLLRLLVLLCPPPSSPLALLLLLLVLLIVLLLVLLLLVMLLGSHHPRQLMCLYTVRATTTCPRCSLTANRRVTMARL